MENENGFQPQSLVNCAGADIQPHIRESGECCSDGHEGRTDGASQIQRLVFTTISATGQNSSLLLQQTGSLPDKPAALTVVAQKKKLLFGAKLASGAKVEQNVQNIPFSTPLGLPHSPDSLVPFATSHD